MSYSPSAAATAVPAASSSASLEATYGKIAWRLIPFLVFLFVLAWIDRVNVGFAKL